MATNNIWDEAKRHAEERSKNVSKSQRRLKRQSVLDGPMSMLKLILLLMTAYALFQYVPAFINFDKIISQTTKQPGAHGLVTQRDNWGAAAPLRDYIKMKKAYVRAGQSLQLQYILPDDAHAVIMLKRCKSIPIVEIFNCTVVQTETIDLKDETIGTRRFQVIDSGMYLLESQVQVTNDERFDIVWQRG